MSETDHNSSAKASADQAERSQRSLLGLQIPQQSPPPADSMLLNGKKIDAWFEALPMASVGETARRVFSTLVEFNRTEVPDLLRAKTVEKFRPPVDYIIENLQKYYVDVGLPLSPKGWKTAALARELQKELAISYKIIVERMVSGDSKNFDSRLLVISLHRALHYLGETLLQNALIYATWPEGIWREINSIYAYASQNEIHEVPVKPDDGRGGGARTTIEDLFKSFMLFASATPQRLRQSQARLLYANLLEWSGFTKLLKEDDGGTSLGRFNVDLWTDSPPMHNALRTPVPGKRIAILDVRDLLKKLRSDFEDAPWDNRTAIQSAKPVVTRPLLRLLIVAWSRPPDRHFVRTRLNFDLNVVAGMHAVYDNLQAGEQAPYGVTRTPLFMLEEDAEATQPRRPRKIQWSAGSLENVSLAPLDSDFVSDSMFRDSHLLPPREGEPPAQLKEFVEPPRSPSAEGGGETPRHAVTTVNESAGGYCIRWAGKEIPRVRIGELIGVESPMDRRRYGLGVIRWMKQQADHSLDLGLEVISTRCEAAELRETGTPSPRKPALPLKCLVINDTDRATNATASLVMTPMSLQTGTELVLTIGDRVQVIRLTKLVEFSSAFARYQFEFVQTEERTETGERHPGDEFDDLWSSL